jgi:Mg/Co/Ni transporter MgtE
MTTEVFWLTAQTSVQQAMEAIRQVEDHESVFYL